MINAGRVYLCHGQVTLCDLIRQVVLLHRDSMKFVAVIFIRSASVHLHDL